MKLYDINSVAIESPAHKNPGKSYDSPQYHELYHHTEQAWMAYLHRKDRGQFFIKERLKALKPAYVAGVIVDLYSDREVCPNCAVGLIGCQCSYEDGFLSELGKMLDTLHIEHPPHLFLSTRVSAESTVLASSIKKKEAISSVIVNPEKNRSFVFEALGQKYSSEDLEQDPLYKNPCMIFSSRKLADKVPQKIQKVVTEWEPPHHFAP